MAAGNERGSSVMLRVMAVFFGAVALAGWGVALLKMSEVRDLKESRASAMEALQGERDSLRVRLGELEKQVADARSQLEQVLSVTEQTETVRHEDLVKEREKLETVLKKEIAEEKAKVEQMKGQVKLTLLDLVLFDLGQATIRPEGKLVLDRVAEILAEDNTGRTISIEGHCDNVPISLERRHLYKTNWELSVARSLEVLRYFEEVHGIDPVLMSAVGCGEFRPVAPNDTVESRQQNRRVEIILDPRVLDR